MNLVKHLVFAASLVLCLASCSKGIRAPITVTAKPVPISGERLAYLVGCINCHHQTPKEILNAPPLVVVKAYSPEEFRTLIKTGVTRDGRDMYAQGSIMGIVEREQLSHFTEQELMAVYQFLHNDWTAQRAAKKKEKIA